MQEQSPSGNESVRLNGRRPLGRKTLFWLGVVTFALFFTGLNNHILWDYHEPYVGGIVREMVHSGDWIVPTLNGHPYLEKPPLFYVLGAICCKVFRSFDPWVLRLPSAMLASLTVAWAAYLGWRVSSARAGAWAGFMVATGFLFFQIGHMAVVDMTLTAALTLSLGLAYLAVVEPAGRRRLLAFFWASMGFTFLAKGLFGPVMVLLPLGILLLLQRDKALVADFIRPNGGMLVALLLGLGWVVPLALKGGQEFLLEVFVRNSIGRFLASPDLVPRTGAWGEHVEPFYFYLARTPGNLLPWLVIWGASMAWVIPWRRRRHPLSLRHLFIPMVFLLDLLFLSVSAGKRMVYLLPVLPITFVHAGLWLDQNMPKGRDEVSRGMLVILAFTLGLVGLLGAAAPWVIVARAGMPWPLALVLMVVSLLLSSFTVRLIWQQRFPRALEWTMVQWALCLLAVLLFGAPALDRVWRPILEPFEIAGRLEMVGARIYEGRLTETQLGYASLAYRHVLPSVASLEEVRQALASPEPVAILLETRHFWRKDVRDRVPQDALVPTQAAYSRKLWDRAPTLLVNPSAEKLLQETSGAGAILRPMGHSLQVP